MTKNEKTAAIENALQVLHAALDKANMTTEVKGETLTASDGDFFYTVTVKVEKL